MESAKQQRIGGSIHRDSLRRRIADKLLGPAAPQPEERTVLVTIKSVKGNVTAAAITSYQVEP